MTDRQWLLRLVPAFPLVLLTLRLWYLSRQNVQTMLLLVQYVSALGLISTLLITLVWVFPAVVLVGRALAALLRVSTLDVEQGDRPVSWLVRTDARMPDWVVAIAAIVAGLTWQLRFLPTLVLLCLSIAALITAERYRDHAFARRVTAFAIPTAVGILELLCFTPAIAAAFRTGDPLTALLLGAPPLLGPLVTGPVPTRWARPVTHWPAVAAALVAPFLIGALFLRAPILPASALEVGTGHTTPDVLRGEVINVDDHMTTLLDAGGAVHFILNDQILSRTLCDTTDDAPISDITVHGWPVETTALAWIAPPRPTTAPDPRCEGRPLP